MNTEGSRDVALEWMITGYGSATLTWSVDGAAILIRTTYMGDGLRSILSAANDLKLGSRASLAYLLREPSGHLFLFAGARTADVYVQIAFFPYLDHSEERRWSGGELVWSGLVNVGSLLGAVRDMAESLLERHGFDGYGREWGMPFPLDELTRLQGSEGGRCA
jgi:hypothetical protein